MVINPDMSSPMLLLITDTSGRNGCVALARADSTAESISISIEVIEEVPLAGGTFSAELVPQIAALLSNHGFSKSDIGAFVVVSGPGSFTGLRIGLAAIKALAEILHKPIVPVSLLEVVATAAGARGKVIAVRDAGRGEVYAGEYEVSNDAATLVREQLLTKDELVSTARGQVVVTPVATQDDALAGFLQSSGISVSRLDSIRAEMIAQVGYRRLQHDQSVSPEQLEANYIRRTDAEIFAKTSSPS
jgi:tRNA threonylcarbamoyladenosine biosynthesis protein TsaB